MITVTRYDGTKIPFNADKINRSIERACEGLFDPVAKVTQIATETRLTLYDGITTDELDLATINAAVQNIKEDIEYDMVAVRLLLKTVYRKVIGEYDKDNNADLIRAHTEGFIAFIEAGVADKRLHPKMGSSFDLHALSEFLAIERDELFQYAGLDGLVNRYLMKNIDQTPRETPQFFFMRIAMGLSYNEPMSNGGPTEMAKKFYTKMSKLEYIAGGSTNLAAGTINPALSNCYLLEIHDDMAHIAKSVADVMMLSKGSGGIGASLTKLRSSGSPLTSNNGASTGPTPFAKIIDTAIRAIQRGGKKKGALCFYMENWHHDFPEFLDWKQGTGDDYMRMRTANTAVFMSDEFMRRVHNGEDWYMFDPKETPDLNELYGKAFAERYVQYTEMADKGMLRTYKKVPATEQFRQILVALQTTSHPWLTWKDAINLRALNNNTGTIHMSNLCTEICLPQDKENVAVCNLASLNLATHIKNKEVNWARLEESVRLAVRQLDNLIDINVLPIPEAAKSDRENRAIGLGVMGFSDTIEQLGMAYDSPHAWDFADRIFEFISYMAIDESANLAQERGSYMHFQGSGWSKGMVPIDTLKTLEDNRGIPLTVSKESRHKGLNWDILRGKVAKGMRNSTLMAVAPNANIGLVAATTPGIDPRFAQVFSRNKISGKYLDLNHNLVKDLKNMGIWEKVKESIIENQGDISEIEDIPDHIKNIYKTSFTTSPYAFIEVAARAQKWVDQALSRNMYLETRDNDEIMKIYKTAWEKGVKTTYYLHMKPRHTAEQSTVNVNKSQKMGRIGFGALNLAVSPAFSAPLQKSLEMPEVVPHVYPLQIPISVPTFVPHIPEPIATIVATVSDTPVRVGGFAVVSMPVAPPLSYTKSVSEVSVAETVAEVMDEEDPMVSHTISHVVPQKSPESISQYQPTPKKEPVYAMQHTASHMQSTPARELSSNETDSLGPVDPADDENNVCIACQ